MSPPQLQYVSFSTSLSSSLLVSISLLAMKSIAGIEFLIFIQYFYDILYFIYATIFLRYFIRYFIYDTIFLRYFIYDTIFYILYTIQYFYDWYFYDFIDFFFFNNVDHCLCWLAWWADKWQPVPSAVDADSLLPEQQGAEALCEDAHHAAPQRRHAEAWGGQQHQEQACEAHDLTRAQTQAPLCHSALRPLQSLG